MKVDIQTLTQGFSRGKLLVDKYSPEILLGLGVVGVVASAVMAAKATLKADEVNIENYEKIEKVQRARVNNSIAEYSEEDYRKDVMIVKVQNAANWVKLYAPSALLMGTSILALIGSHGIMQNRASSMAAAYSLLQEGFNSYRRRVVAELGENKDRDFRFGLVEVESTEETVNPKTGRKNKKKVKAKDRDPNAKSDYARFFDEYSINWRKDSQMNLFFLKAQQNYANDKLQAQGHLFLNEVYDLLGFPRSREGTVVGWIRNGDGDGFVDFGIYEPENGAFVNGYEASVLLDFNVDGLIHDLI